MALSFEIEFGSTAAAAFRSEGRAGLRLPLPRLAGEGIERIFGPVEFAGEKEGFSLYAAGDLLVGCAVEPESGGMEATATAFYQRLLAAAGGRHLHRIWNYVPEINREKDGLENYRAFNAGRARAFELGFGPGYRDRLGAASGVGCDGAALAAVFVAGPVAGRQFENPQQVPAYHYPPEHGPSAPSFSRATAAVAGGQRFLFISGTAAIKGHRTVAPAAIEGQIDCMLENLRLITAAAGTDQAGWLRRHFKVYLRHPADLALARARLEAELFRPGDRVAWLQAGLCRAELRIEVEQTLVG
jgi:enamine deaminase RidA (YjgF/YER057c/UK114 family)